MTILRVDHTGIAVWDLDEALSRYRRLFGLVPGHRSVVEDQQVEVAFLPAGDTQVELICPLNRDSGVARFLEQFGERVHHLAFLVDNLDHELERLRRDGVKLIDQSPRPGSHGRIAFIHPHGSGGPLVELVERTDGDALAST